jgi:hypothetical protein
VDIPLAQFSSVVSAARANIQRRRAAFTSDQFCIIPAELVPVSFQASRI